MTQTTTPRFAIGESTIPYTLVTLRLISERYKVPEIKDFATFTNATKKIGNSFGVKKHFGFLKHNVGEEQNPAEVNQFGTPGLLHESSHLFRQDMDAYMFYVALNYGCESVQNEKIDDVTITDEGVVLGGSHGTYRGRYVVDASGFRSPLAQTFGLRDDVCRFKHHSRAIFTHMIGVNPLDEVLQHGKEDTPPNPWETGTVHHLFERGWLWVIPFNNHKSSRNPLCSVGLTLDPRYYPKREGQAPEEEFYDFVNRFPTLQRVFADARPVRDWVSTGRLQYSSKKVVGHRYCLLAHAAGFIDPLFSRGLSNTSEVINALAWRLLASLGQDDFSVERFEYVERLQQGLLDYNDNLVNSAYISFSDYELWNAVFKIWSLGSNAGTFRLQNTLTQFLKTHDDSLFVGIEDPPNLGLWWPDYEGYKDLFSAMVTYCEQVDRGELPSQVAADELFHLLQDSDFVPPFIGFNNRTRYLKSEPIRMGGTALWAMSKAPKDIRRLLAGTFTAIMLAAMKGKRLF